MRTLTKEERKAVAVTKYNVTDPDSGIVRHRGMLIQGYNIQTVVGEGQVILAARATGIAGDGGQLAPSVTAAQQNLARVGIDPDDITQIVADSGYWDNTQIRQLTQDGRQVLVPPHDRKRGRQAGPEPAAMTAALSDPDTQRDLPATSADHRAGVRAHQPSPPDHPTAQTR